MSTSYSSSLSDRSLHSKPSEMSRSGSFFGAIKSIVSTPLSWWGSMGRGEEPVKRRRDVIQVASDDERDEVVKQRSKRMRIASPDDQPARSRPSAGYLDPPVGTFPAARRRLNMASTVPPPISEDMVFDGQEFGYAPSKVSTRMMSVDPPSRHASLREGSLVPLPEPSPIRSSFSLGPRERSVQPRHTPLKLRSSLTPQPSGARPVRREASAPPPLSSLQTRPKFVKAPAEDIFSQDIAQKTVSLGALADIVGRRTSRSPTRERTLTKLGSISTIPIDSLSNASFSTPQTAAEKALQGLEMYKTPILPSRHKEAKVYPEFLRPKRSHVPIPMSKKGRDVSGGSSPKRKERSRDVGKPYAGRSGLSKIMRNAQETKAQPSTDEAKNYRTDEDGDAEMESLRGSSKRDVGVGTQFSEDESRARKREAIAKVSAGLAPIEALTDPYADPSRSRQVGGREQPYGRVGRTRVREVGKRAVPIMKKPGRFSANIEDLQEEDGVETQTMDTASDAGRGIEDKSAASVRKDQIDLKPTFKAPEGFTFATAEASIQHDTRRAKEPPLPSLPFSLEKPAALPTDDVRPVFPTFSAPTPVTEKVAPLQTPMSNPVAAGSSEAVTVLSTAQVPKEQATPTSTIPNFFANSPFTVKTPSAIESTTPKTTPPSHDFAAATPSFATPAKESDTPKSTPPFVVPKPLFGNAVPAGTKPSGNGNFGSPSPLFSVPSKVPDALNETTSGAPSLFGETGKATASTTPTSNAPASSPFTFGGQAVGVTTSQAENKPSSAASPFSFPSASGDSVPKPLFGGQSAPVPSVAPPQTSVDPKPSPFTFGAPAVANTPSNSSVSPELPTHAPKPVFGGAGGFSFGAPSSNLAPQGADNSKPSTPFAFGAPPATPPVATENRSPFFGSPAPVVAPGSAGGSAFTFGATSKPVEAPPATSSPAPTSPFVFGAAPPRPVTPPTKLDDGMSMEASPTRMDTNIAEVKPTGSISFGSGAIPNNPFAQSNGTATGFTFGGGAPVTNPFAKEAPKADPSGFNFTRTASAPAISTAFSFGQKADVNTPPASAVGPSSNPFTQPPTSSGSSTGNAPFSFGQASSASNPFGTPASAATQPVSNAFSSSGAFSFGTPSSGVATSNPFAFGSSQPSSPAVASSGLPGSPAVANSNTPAFSFGQSSGSGGSSLFNIGAAPTNTTPGSAQGRAIKRLPKRGPPRR